MTKDRLREIIRTVGLALCSCDNCVTTDVPGLHEPLDDLHWEIDKKKR